jgi:hypothetical protein
MRRWVVAIIAGTILLVVTTGGVLSAQAQEASRGQFKYNVFGTEVAGCGPFIEAVEGEHKARPNTAGPRNFYTREYGIYVSYATGFLTGVSWGIAHTLIRNDTIGASFLSDYESLMVWLESYCRAHPLDQYVDALTNLRIALEAKEPQ